MEDVLLLGLTISFFIMCLGMIQFFDSLKRGGS